MNKEKFMCIPIKNTSSIQKKEKTSFFPQIKQDLLRSKFVSKNIKSGEYQKKPSWIENIAKKYNPSKWESYKEWNDLFNDQSYIMFLREIGGIKIKYYSTKEDREDLIQTAISLFLNTKEKDEKVSYKMKGNASYKKGAIVFINNLKAILRDNTHVDAPDLKKELKNKFKNEVSMQRLEEQNLIERTHDKRFKPTKFFFDLIHDWKNKSSEVYLDSKLKKIISTIKNSLKPNSDKIREEVGIFELNTIEKNVLFSELSKENEDGKIKPVDTEDKRLTPEELRISMENLYSIKQLINTGINKLNSIDRRLYDFIFFYFKPTKEISNLESIEKILKTFCKEMKARYYYEEFSYIKIEKQAISIFEGLILEILKDNPTFQKLSFKKDKISKYSSIIAFLEINHELLEVEDKILNQENRDER